MVDQVQPLLNTLKERLASAGEACEGSGREESQLSDISAALRELLQGYSIVQNGVNTTPAMESMREHVNATNGKVSELRQRLQPHCESLQQTVEDAKAVLEDAGTNPLPATPEAVQQLLLYAHRLGYSTFLPLLGEHLVQHGVAQHFRPSPASLQNSYLKKAAMAHEAAIARERAMEASRSGPAGGAVAAAPEDQLMAPPIPVMPDDWKPGDPIPMPPGWAPGDPIPLPPMAQPPSVAQVEEALAADAAVAPDVGPPAMDLDAGIDDDFVLNAEAISGSEEESSEEEEEGEEDDDAPGSRAVSDSEMRSASGTDGEDGTAADSD